MSHPLLFPVMLGFEGLGVATAILAGIRGVGAAVVHGLRVALDVILRFFRWCVSHPDEAITLGAMLWALLA